MTKYRKRLEGIEGQNDLYKKYKKQIYKLESDVISLTEANKTIADLNEKMTKLEE